MRFLLPTILLCSITGSAQVPMVSTSAASAAGAVAPAGRIADLGTSSESVADWRPFEPSDRSFAVKFPRPPEPKLVYAGAWNPVPSLTCHFKGVDYRVLSMPFEEHPGVATPSAKDLVERFLNTAAAELPDSGGHVTFTYDGDLTYQGCAAGQGRLTGDSSEGVAIARVVRVGNRIVLLFASNFNGLRTKRVSTDFFGTLDVRAASSPEP